MDLRENLSVSLDSIKSNLLRTILTALIIAIGIASLVGILTAIDGMQQTINENMSNLGANTFTLEARGMDGRRSQRGVEEKIYPAITYDQAKRFKDMYRTSTVSVSTYLSGSAEVKRLSEKTNPNISIVGGDENYLSMEGFDLANGRNF